MTAPLHAHNELFDVNLTDSAAKKTFSGFIGDINRYQPTFTTNTSHAEAFKELSNLLEQIRGNHASWDAWFKTANDEVITQAFNALVGKINEYAIVKKGIFGKESDLFKAKERLVQAQQKLIKEQQEHINQLAKQNAQLEQQKASLREQVQRTEKALEEQWDKNDRLESQNRDLTKENKALSKEKESLTSQNLKLSEQIKPLQEEKALAIQDRDAYKASAERAAEREAKAQERITAVEKDNLVLKDNIRLHIGQVEQTDTTLANLQEELSKEKARSAELAAENKVFKSWVSELAGILSKLSVFIKPIFGEEKARQFENFLQSYAPYKATFWGKSASLNDVMIQENYDPNKTGTATNFFVCK